MVGAFHASRARGRSISVMLPPPAPVPRFSLLPPLPPSEPTLDDAEPTRPWMPDPPTTPYAPSTPPTSWAIPASSWDDDPATLARNAPTIRPPSRASSRLRVAFYGFAAGLAFGAFGLVTVLGVEASAEGTGGAQAHGANTGAIVGAAAAAPPAVTRATAVVAPAASSVVPVVRAEDLPRASVRVEDLPTAVVRARDPRKRR